MRILLRVQSANLRRVESSSHLGLRRDWPDGARTRRRVSSSPRPSARSRAGIVSRWLWGLTHNAGGLDEHGPALRRGGHPPQRRAWPSRWRMRSFSSQSCPGRAGRGAFASPSSRGSCPFWSCCRCSAGGSLASGSARARCRSSGTWSCISCTARASAGPIGLGDELAGRGGQLGGPKLATRRRTALRSGSSSAQWLAACSAGQPRCLRTVAGRIDDVESPRRAGRRALRLVLGGDRRAASGNGPARVVEPLERASALAGAQRVPRPRLVPRGSAAGPRTRARVVHSLHDREALSSGFRVALAPKPGATVCPMSPR